jgi:hemerythrin-like domain-containing protein
MKITETLVTEHRIFLGVFEQIDRLLPDVRTVAEIRRLACLVEGLLERHGGNETELAYLALDHVLQDKGRLDRLHQEHQEIDGRLREVQTAPNCATARRLLGSALSAARDHFQFEERFVFPLLEATLAPGTLAELGADWRQRAEAS